MTAKQKKKSNAEKVHKLEKTEQLVDKYARGLQIISVISVVALLIFNGLVPAASIPSYVIIGLLGVAVGLQPEQIGEMITNVLKTFIGKK